MSSTMCLPNTKRKCRSGNRPKAVPSVPAEIYHSRILRRNQEKFMEKLIEISLKILFWITVGFVVLYLPRIIGWFGALRPQKRLTNDKKSRFALLVPARNESLAIGDLFRAIGEQDYDSDFFDVHVIVKEPDDPTIEMAENIGAHVHVVPEQTCKGDALDGALKTILTAGEKYDAYRIIFPPKRAPATFGRTATASSGR